VPSPRKPGPGAAQPKPKVRKILDTTTSLGAPGARSGPRGLYIPAANDPRYLRYRLASDHRCSRAATAASYRTPPAQKVDILHKKLSLNGALCAKPPNSLDSLMGLSGELLGRATKSVSLTPSALHAAALASSAREIGLRRKIRRRRP
jgi:hypothetical protein